VTTLPLSSQLINLGAAVLLLTSFAVLGLLVHLLLER